MIEKNKMIEILSNLVAGFGLNCGVRSRLVMGNRDGSMIVNSKVKNGFSVSNDYD